MTRYKTTVNWINHDRLVLKYLLDRHNLTESIFLPNRTATAVEQRSFIWSLLRFSSTVHSPQMSWTRIRDVCNMTHHSGLIRAVKQYIEKHGPVESICVPVDIAPSTSKESDVVVRETI